MKECENCPHCVKCDGHLVCINKSSDNYDEYIEEITECDVFKTGKLAAGVENHTESFDFAAQVENDSDSVNHPVHYTNRQHECIKEMITAFGTQAVINFCICNAWKYRYRANSKGKHDEDMAKSDWYMNKAMELQKEMKEEKLHA